MKRGSGALFFTAATGDVAGSGLLADADSGAVFVDTGFLTAAVFVAPVELLVEAGRGAVGELDPAHRQADALALELGVGEPPGVHHARAALLQPDQVVGVVGHAHLVGLGVADAQVVLVRLGHPWKTTATGRTLPRPP